MTNEPAGACNAAAVQNAVGQVATKTRLADIQRRSGAATLRVLPPGAAATRDFRTDRLNVHVDAANRIERLDCG